MDWFYCSQCRQWAIDCPNCEYGTTCNGGCGCEETWEYYENNKPPAIKQNQKLTEALEEIVNLTEYVGQNQYPFGMEKAHKKAQQALDEVLDNE